MNEKVGLELFIREISGMYKTLSLVPETYGSAFAPPATARVSNEEIDRLGLPRNFGHPLDEASERMITPQERAELLSLAGRSEYYQFGGTEPANEMRRRSITKRIGASVIAGTQNALTDVKRWYERSDTGTKRMVKLGSACVGLVCAVLAVRGGIPRLRVVDHGTVNVPGDASIINIYPQNSRGDRQHQKDLHYPNGLAAA